MMTEAQFYERHHDRSYRYDDYKLEYKNFHARQYFENHKNEEKFIERYHPAKIVERRKRDAAEAQNLAEQFLLNFKTQILSLQIMTPVKTKNYSLNQK